MNGLPINILQHEKMQQNPYHGRSLRYWCSYFCQSMGASFPPDTYPMVSHEKCIGLLTNILYHEKRQKKSSYMKSLGNQYPQFSQNIGAFVPPNSYSMVCFITWKMRGSSHQYPIARKMQQIYPLGRTWETDTHTSPKV